MTNRNRMSLMTFPIALDLIFKRMRIADTLKLAANAGIPYVDIMNITEEKLAEYRAAMEATQVKIYCYIVSISFFREPQVMSGQITDCLKMAKALEAQMLMIVPYKGDKDLTLAKTLGREATRQKMIDGFRLAVRLGEQYSIPVCFETTPHDELCLSGTEDSKAVLDAVSGLGLVLDTANMLPHGDDPVEAYETLKSYMVHVHLKDVVLDKRRVASKHSEHSSDGWQMRCTVWGDGMIPISTLYQKMLADGYKGYFAIEYVHPNGLICGMEKHATQLQRFLEKEIKT